MGFEVLYWHWIVFGIALMLAELVIPTFFALWFGGAAVLVGLLLLAMPELAVSWQVVIWTVFSVLLAIGWFKFLKPLSVDRTKAGLSREAVLGEVGQVIRVPGEETRGSVRFSIPVLGADEWQMISRDELAAGDRVRVIDVSGNALVVEKV